MCIRAIDEGIIRYDGARKTVYYMYLVPPTLYQSAQKYRSLSLAVVLCV